MAYINCDTNKMTETGNEILKLVGNLKEVLNEYYKRLENIKDTTGEWVGPSAETFIARVTKSKKTNMDFCESLALYGKYFIDSAEQINSTIRRNSL